MTPPDRVPAIDVTEASRRLREASAAPAPDGLATPAPLLVDVREPVEFVQFRAEGAILFPLSSWMERFRELPRDRPLLMICRTGARSGQATAFLLASGWTDVVNVAGGTEAWARAGLPLRNGPPDAEERRLPG